MWNYRSLYCVKLSSVMIEAIAAELQSHGSCMTLSWTSCLAIERRHEGGLSCGSLFTTASEAASHTGLLEKTCTTKGDERILSKQDLAKPQHILDLIGQCGLSTDSYTSVCLLQGCINQKALAEGKIIHAHMIKSGFKNNVFVGTTLVDMYAKCGTIKDAKQVFDQMPEHDLVSWNVMIAGYTKRGLSRQAFGLFQQMESEGAKPDTFTYLSIINACGALQNLNQCRSVHCLVLKSDLQLHTTLENALIDMYARCGSMEDALQVFKKMPQQDVISWNALIAGYTKSANAEEGLRLFQKMVQEGMQPNEVTFLCSLNACASLGNLEQARGIHYLILQTGINDSIYVANTLIDTYAKCGIIADALQIFDKMSERDKSTWNAMIAGYSRHGLCQQALELADQMHQECVKLNHITFVCILSACSHAGMLDEGFILFNLMNKDYVVTPIEEHYACMVDLLGRAGHLHLAVEFIEKLPSQPTTIVWRALLGACRIHRDLEIAKSAAECITDLELRNNAVSLLLSHIHATIGNHADG